MPLLESWQDCQERILGFISTSPTFAPFSVNTCQFQPKQSALPEDRRKLILPRESLSVMLRLLQHGHGGRAKDGNARMSLEVSGPVGWVERAVGGRAACSQSLVAADATAGRLLCLGMPRCAICCRSSARGSVGLVAGRNSDDTMTREVLNREPARLCAEG
jgi:hypothetical protein